MNKPTIIVDKIENSLANCEINGKLTDIPLALIDGVVKEGDILVASENGARYSVAKEETALRRAAMAERFKRLKSRSE